MIEYQEKMMDRQVGRNADLFAEAIGKIPTKEERYAYIRILIGIVEQAHQEWNQAPNKDRQVANLIFRMSRGEVEVDEVAEVVRLLDQERGYAPIPEPPPVAEPEAATTESAESPEETKSTDAASGDGSAPDSGDEAKASAETDGGVDTAASAAKAGGETDATPDAGAPAGTPPGQDVSGETTQGESGKTTKSNGAAD